MLRQTSINSKKMMDTSDAVGLTRAKTGYVIGKGAFCGGAKFRDGNRLFLFICGLCARTKKLRRDGQEQQASHSLRDHASRPSLTRNHTIPRGTDWACVDEPLSSKRDNNRQR